MKRMLWIAAAAVLALSSISCSSSKKAGKPMTDGEVEIAIPLSGAEYQTNAEYWRSVQFAASKDASMAKKLAVQNARQELAATVQSQLKAVMENYAKQSDVNSNREHSGVYQEMAHTVVNQTMNGVELAGEKLFRLENGDYRYHVCLQMNKEQVFNAAAEALTAEERLQLEFDKAQFKKVFDEEMAKLEKAK